MAFNRYTFQIRITSIDSHYICMLCHNATEDEAREFGNKLVPLIDNWYQVEIINLKTGIEWRKLRS